MRCSESPIQTYDGLTLHTCSWAPADAARAVICLVHGLGEHCGRYRYVAEHFTSAGYALMAADLRGHGLSEGKRGHTPDYITLTDDLYQLLEAARERYSETPVFLYGHSLGGNIALYLVLRRLPHLAGLIACSPLFIPSDQPPAWKVRLLRLLSRRVPSFTVANGIDPEALSRDPEVVEAYRNDPLVHDRISARLATEMLRIGRWNLARASELSLPMLLMHGTADRITSPQASEKFAEKAGDLCTLKLWDGFYHELHNEPEKQQVLSTAVSWMDEMIL